jgi:hypothetical protein
LTAEPKFPHFPWKNRRKKRKEKPPRKNNIADKAYGNEELKEAQGSGK